MSQPLTNLLKKGTDVPRDWDSKQDTCTAVLNIKKFFVSPPLLTHFDPTKPLYLQTDASHFALGAVLCHVETVNGKQMEKPICYASKTLKKAQINYSVTEKECPAVVWSTELFRTMLLGHQFTLQTDHSALRNLLTNKVAQGRLARWSIKLQEFDMEVQHRKGTDHNNADFLSRLEQMTDGTYQISMEMVATQACTRR